jgi:hypothetical protein
MVNKRDLKRAVARKGSSTTSKAPPSSTKSKNSKQSASQPPSVPKKKHWPVPFSGKPRSAPEDAAAQSLLDMAQPPASPRSSSSDGSEVQEVPAPQDQEDEGEGEDEDEEDEEDEEDGDDLGEHSSFFSPWCLSHNEFP